MAVPIQMTRRNADQLKVQSSSFYFVDMDSRFSLHGSKKSMSMVWTCNSSNQASTTISNTEHGLQYHKNSTAASC
jgi:hypothetical protein